MPQLALLLLKSKLNQPHPRVVHHLESQARILASLANLAANLRERAAHPRRAAPQSRRAAHLPSPSARRVDPSQAESTPTLARDPDHPRDQADLDRLAAAEPGQATAHAERALADPTLRVEEVLRAQEAQDPTPREEREATLRIPIEEEAAAQAPRAAEATPRTPTEGEAAAQAQDPTQAARVSVTAADPDQADLTHGETLPRDLTHTAHAADLTLTRPPTHARAAELAPRVRRLE